MVRWTFVIALIAGGCAQVGTITGGATDEIAPKVLGQLINDKQCNVTAQEQVLVFDEYIKLNQAQQRITLMPADSRLNFVLKAKTLHIAFLDKLQPQTTYTLTSNGGIQDLTEGNDSLMTWTFSTGAGLDSLQLIARAEEILPNTKQTTIQLGIYLNDTSKTARYLGRFDQQGQLHLKGLKEGAYFLKAYVDENQDGVCSALESQDALFKPIQLDQIQTDTLRFYLSKPLLVSDTLLPTNNSINPIQSDTTNTPVETSTLIITLDTLQEFLLLELYRSDILIKQTPVTAKTTTLLGLEAGVYTLRFVLDQNQNLKWDAIDLQKQVRAEAIYYYPEKIKIRPNWELTLPVNIPTKRLFTN